MTMTEAAPEPSAVAPEPGVDPPTTPRSGLGLAAAAGLAVTVVGLLIGLAPLRDNSFWTHLATGRLILDQGGVPTADPYSFTAPGSAWTVQSWLASVAYAGAEELGGLLGIRLLVGLATALLAALVWRLTAPAGSVAARAGLCLPVLLIGWETWTERPMLFGLLALAATWLLADGVGRPWLAVPLFWLWVNTHGSFPLGGALLVCLLVGRALDRRPVTTEARVLGWAVLGTLLGGLNPVGPRLLMFPVELLTKSEALGTIKEWQPPSPSDPATQLFALFVLVAAVLLVRRPTWRQVLPAVVFVLAAALGARNVAPASIVLLAAVAPSLTGLGGTDGRRPHPLAPLTAGVLVVLALVAGVGLLSRPHTDLVGYPTGAVTWLEEEGLLGEGQRLVSRDYVGNYLEARYGTEVPVFIDDRYDMFPIEVVRDYRALVEADADWPAVLERWDADVLLWDRDSALGQDLVDGAEGWEVVHGDDQWLVLRPT